MPSLLNEFNFVKGFLAYEEGILLYEMAKKYCTKSFAVEIGSYCGKSACYIGQACKEKGTHLVTIDHHRGSEEQQFGEEYFDSEEYDYKKNRVDTLPTLLRNISKFELDEHIKVVVDNSESASKKIKGEIDFLFIDGSHTFASARNDYESWKNKYELVEFLQFTTFMTQKKKVGKLQEKYSKKLLQKILR